MATPFFSAFDSIGTPNGTWIKPGGNVVAYVRSTGVQSGDITPVSDLLVSTIAAGVARCRPGMNDVVGVLPGHTETITGSLFTAVSGAQIIGMGNPGAVNAPTVVLGGTAATIALSAANMTLMGLNITSATAAVTGAIVITGAGVTLANNFISFTGALAANVAIQVTGAATCRILDNNITIASTATMIAVTGAASTNFLISGNHARQITSGSFSTTAATAAISGMYSRNFFKTAATTTAGAGVIVIDAATLTTVGNFENYGCDETAAGALLVTGA